MAAKYAGWRIMATSKGVVELTPWEITKQPEPGQVIVQNLCSLVSPGTELSRIHDTHTVHMGFPCAIGYLSSGRIVQLGPGVTDYKVGDRVLATMGHMSYGLVDAKKGLLKVPDNVPLEKAVFAGLAGIPMRGVLCGRLAKGDTALVIGQGCIGLFATWWCKYYGASKVVAFDKVPARLERARQFGADVAVDPGSDMMAALKTALGDRANVVLDATGTPAVIAASFELTKDNGRVVVLGGIHKPVTLDLYTHFQKRNLTLVGAGYPSPEAGTRTEEQNRQECLDLIASGRMPVEKATTHVVPVQQAPELYRMMVEQPAATCGVVFRWPE
jgi:2-desacetyl-2-hydroxyethyl bacteriochlorophyllide A dehydrogenase